MEAVRVRKIDAARRQLDHALHLWFHDGDAVAMHTLAAAAHQIVADILRSRGLPDPTFDSPRIRDEFRKQWINLQKKPANFFKHADKDPEGEIEFNPAINGFKLLSCAFAMDALRAGHSDIEDAFCVRFALENPRILKQGTFEEHLSPQDMANARTIPRAEFLGHYLRERKRIAQHVSGRSSGRPAIPLK